MKLFIKEGDLKTIMDAFNEKFKSENYEISKKQIHERQTGSFWIEVWYRDKVIKNKVYPDSTKCINVKTEVCVGVILKDCLPCGGNSCREIFGTDFCFAHYKPRDENGK